MASDILLMNIRSWTNLKLSTPSNPIPKKGYQKKQHNHAIIDNMMDELHMVESKKVSAVNHEASEFL